MKRDEEEEREEGMGRLARKEKRRAEMIINNY